MAKNKNHLQCLKCGRQVSLPFSVGDECICGGKFEEIGFPFFDDDLKGLPRQCPMCSIIAHYDISGKKPQEVSCPNCDYKFTIKKYKRGERPR